MARHIPNLDKLIRILDHNEKNGKKDFAFTMDESLRIRQLVGESLVAFFAAINGYPNPGPQPIPPGTPGTGKRPKVRKKRT